MTRFESITRKFLKSVDKKIEEFEAERKARGFSKDEDYLLMDLEIAKEEVERLLSDWTKYGSVI